MTQWTRSQMQVEWSDLQGSRDLSFCGLLGSTKGSYTSVACTEQLPVPSNVVATRLISADAVASPRRWF